MIGTSRLMMAGKRMMSSPTRSRLSRRDTATRDIRCQHFTILEKGRPIGRQQFPFYNQFAHFYNTCQHSSAYSGPSLSWVFAARRPPDVSLHVWTRLHRHGEMTHPSSLLHWQQHINTHTHTDCSATGSRQSIIAPRVSYLLQSSSPPPPHHTKIGLQPHAISVPSPVVACAAPRSRSLCQVTPSSCPKASKMAKKIDSLITKYKKRQRLAHVCATQCEDNIGDAAKSTSARRTIL